MKSAWHYGISIYKGNVTVFDAFLTFAKVSEFCEISKKSFGYRVVLQNKSVLVDVKADMLEFRK